MQRVRRREFLTLLAGALVPPEQRRYADPATELDVLRLTDPEHRSVLPRQGASHRGNFLLYASDRSGSMQAFRMELKTGESRQLTDAPSLDPTTVTLLPDDNRFLYLSEGTLVVAQMNGKQRTLSLPETSGILGGISVSDDGQHAAFSAGTNVCLASLGPKLSVTSLVQVPRGVIKAWIRPRRAQTLYVRTDGSVWLVNFDGQGNRALKMEPLEHPESAALEWSPSGRTLLYLRGTELREHTPDDNLDRPLAKTSQFAGFGVNSDASVFVGASASKASPFVLLLLRITRREFTLCEHRSSDAAQVRPVFTPNNQSVLFQSDRHGKQAIYRMRVEKLVESADSDSPGLFQE